MNRLEGGRTGPHFTVICLSPDFTALASMCVCVCVCVCVSVSVSVSMFICIQIYTISYSWNVVNISVFLD